MITIVGHHDIEPIGRGGLGDVYRAVRASTGGTVAVKVLRDVTDESVAWHRTRRELTALVLLAGHANVITPIDVAQTPHGPALVMEYAARGSVGDLLEHRGGPLTVPEVVLIGRHTAAALSAAHAHHIVHRDVKPHNLLIDGYGQVKLCDFGIASLLRSDEFRARTDALSMRYASPEDLDEHAVVGPPSDVYSLGATLLHLARGAPPTLKERLAPWTAPSTDDTELAALEEVVASCLHPDPDRRPDADQVLERLEHLAWGTEHRCRSLVGAPHPNASSVAAAPMTDREVPHLLCEDDRHDRGRQPGSDTHHETDRVAVSGHVDAVDPGTPEEDRPGPTDATPPSIRPHRVDQGPVHDHGRRPRLDVLHEPEPVIGFGWHDTVDPGAPADARAQPTDATPPSNRPHPEDQGPVHDHGRRPRLDVLHEPEPVIGFGWDDTVDPGAPADARPQPTDATPPSIRPHREDQGRAHDHGRRPRLDVLHEPEPVIGFGWDDAVEPGAPADARPHPTDATPPSFLAAGPDDDHHLDRNHHRHSDHNHHRDPDHDHHRDRDPAECDAVAGNGHRARPMVVDDPWSAAGQGPTVRRAGPRPTQRHVAPVDDRRPHTWIVTVVAVASAVAVVAVVMWRHGNDPSSTDTIGVSSRAAVAATSGAAHSDRTARPTSHVEPTTTMTAPTTVPPTVPPTVPTTVPTTVPSSVAFVDRLAGIGDLDETIWPRGVIGECLAQTAGSDHLAPASCSAPHDLQRIASGELAGSSATDATFDPHDVQVAVVEACEQRFADFVGRNLGDSDFSMPITRPSVGTWARGDRTYQCLVGVPGRRLVGDAAGSGH